jgi:anti-sigma factor RsiW
MLVNWPVVSVGLRRGTGDATAGRRADVQLNLPSFTASGVRYAAGDFLACAAQA